MQSLLQPGGSEKRHKFFNHFEYILNKNEGMRVNPNYSSRISPFEIFAGLPVCGMKQHKNDIVLCDVSDALILCWKKHMEEMIP